MGVFNSLLERFEIPLFNQLPHFPEYPTRLRAVKNGVVKAHGNMEQWHSSDCTIDYSCLFRNRTDDKGNRIDPGGRSNLDTEPAQVAESYGAEEGFKMTG